MKIKFVIIALAALIVVSCGDQKATNEKQKTVTRPVKTGEFCGIQAEGNFVIEFCQDSVTSVKVSGRKADVDDIKVNCRGGVLCISRKPQWGFHINRQEVYVKVASPNLTDISFTGSGVFNVKGYLDTDVLTIEQTGSGEVTLNDVICDRLNLDMSGSGATSINRLRCGSMEASVAGSGDMQCDVVQVRRAVIEVAGSGSASTHTAKIGQGRFSVVGSGDIDIYGAEIGYAVNSVGGSGDIVIKGKVGRHKDETNGSGDVTVSE